MKAMDRLHVARTLASEGRHDAALQEYVWFFEHALEERASLAGVRLSFALGYWMELAEVYPQARLALEEIRDRKAQLLRLHAVVGRSVFLDVAAINKNLGCEQQTYELFKAMAASDEKFARRCADIALPSVLLARDYELAERFLGDPREKVRRESEYLNWMIQCRKQWKYTNGPRIKADIANYAANIQRILLVLEGRGRMAEARDLRLLAVKSVQATTIREAVVAALKPGARPFYERARRPWQSRHE